MIEETAPPQRVVRTVKEFVNGLSAWFKRHRNLQQVSISGELSNVGEFGNGHARFRLKEDEIVIECIMWADRYRLGPELRDGLAVVATGDLRIRPERSGFQLHVDTIELTGVGELHQLYEKLKVKLRDEGLFESSRKRAVPALPRRIGLISAKGRGMEDFMTTLQRNVPFVRVSFLETRVQGIGAEVDVSAALDAFAGAPVDAIVLTRGGGSYEDLFTFNREAVVRAIVRSKLPVITAIGHSYDHHLADEVADVYYGTPSLAAEAISKGWMLAIGRLQNARNDLRRAWRDLAMQRAQRLSEARSSLTRCALRIVNDKGTALARCDVRLERCNPHSRLAAQRGTVHALAARSRAAYSATVARKHTLWNARADRLDRSIGAMHAAALRRIERAQAGLVACDPLSPLSRGYAIVTYAGKALRDARSVAPGEAIEARVERGMLVARVESVTDDD